MKKQKILIYIIILIISAAVLLFNVISGNNASINYYKKQDNKSQKKEKQKKGNQKQAKPDISINENEDQKLKNKNNYIKQLERIDYNKLPKKELRKLIREGSAADILDFYEKHNADINVSLTKKKAMPIFHFLILINQEAAKDIFATGIIDINKSPHVFTASVAKGDKEIIDYLLDIGFSPEQKNKKVRPPYISSVLHGHPEISELLERKGADVYKKYKGKNALDWAITSKFTNTEILENLLKKGFEYKRNHILDAAKYGRTETFEHILKKNPDFIDAYENGENLMDIAVKGSGGKELINLLLKRGFDINKTHLKTSEKRLEKAFIHTKNGKKFLVNSDGNAQEVHNLIVKYLYKRTE